MSTPTTGPRCVSCRGPLDNVRRYRLDGNRGRALFGRTQVARCRQCGLVQATPIPAPAELSDYYVGRYRSGGRHGAMEADLSAFPKDNLFYYHRGRAVVALLERHLGDRGQGEGLRVCDIGAGFGHTLDAVKGRWPRAQRAAVELSGVCVAHLTGCGVTVFSEPVGQWLSAHQEQWDVIVISHVLEHLAEPDATLAQLGSRLAPGGVLFVEVPNIPPASLTATWDHPWAPRWDEPHLLFYSADTFRSVLERAGLVVERLEESGPPYRPISAWAYRMPSLRTVALQVLPAWLVRLLRSRPGLQPLQTFHQEAPFHQTGANGIWLRAIARRRSEP